MEIIYKDLLQRVARRFAFTKPTNDHLVLIRWQILWLCHGLLGRPSDDLKKVYVEALEEFAKEGVCGSTEAKLRDAASMAKHVRRSLFPEISAEKRKEVDNQLEEIEGREGLLDSAQTVLPKLKEYLGKVSADALLSGICYRFQLVADIVMSVNQPEKCRRRAAASILYLAEICDAIDDSLGLIGLLDDDYALRTVLLEGGISERAIQHWSEKVAGIWEDLPFLQGMDLRIREQSIATGWLDRVNSYLCYSHSLNEERDLLLLLEPTIACSLLNPIMALLALLVFDALTSSQDSAKSLVRGRVYAIDEKFFVKYDGVDDSMGWLRLECKGGTYYRSAFLATRMTPADGRPLSAIKDLMRYLKEQLKDPIQRFFGWSDAIGTAAIPGRVVLVTSKRRANEIFDDVESNGVSLMRDGLVRLVGTDPQDAFRGLVLIAPSLSVVRTLMSAGVSVRVVVVDGYDRLREGQYDLPFVGMAENPPSIMVWSPAGYCPSSLPSWLPPHRRVEISTEDLVEILDLDQHLDEHTAASLTSLWETVTGPEVRFQEVGLSAEEEHLITLLDLYVEAIAESALLPQHWRHLLGGRARRLRTLIGATATEWSAIRDAGKGWLESCAEMWSRLTPAMSSELSSLRQQELQVRDALAISPHGANSKGRALSLYISEKEGKSWTVVCGSHEEAMGTRRLLEEHVNGRGEVVTLKDLGVCKHCLVAGWLGSSFGRRLMAHSPREIIAFVGSNESERWKKLSRMPARQRSAIEMIQADGRHYLKPLLGNVEIQAVSTPSTPKQGTDKTDTPSVMLWFADSSNCKILRRESQVIVEQDGRASVREAWSVKPFDQVILGPGLSRWSPAEEFTQAVLLAVEKTRPELVRDAKEWRRALTLFQEEESLSAEEVREKLAGVGVYRELPTIEGWLDLERPSPIGPQQLESGIAAIWTIAGHYSNRQLESVVEACRSLRSLHGAASQAIVRLWAGQRVDNLGVDEAWLRELVWRVRETVDIHEVVRVDRAFVPIEMLGWWIPADFAPQLEIVEASQDDFAAGSDSTYDV